MFVVVLSVRVVLVFGCIVYEMFLIVFGFKKLVFVFGYGVCYVLLGYLFVFFDSYYCLRYNINIGCLSEEMFWFVFKVICVEFFVE